MDEKFDQYGDSYSEMATIDSLRCVMNRVELDVCIFTVRVITSRMLIFVGKMDINTLTVVLLSNNIHYI